MTTRTSPATSGFGIEFLGLPGSGKSTLAGHFIASARQSGLALDTVRAAGRRAMRQRLRRSHARFRTLLTFAAGAAFLRSVYPVSKYEIGAYNRFCILHPELAHAALQAMSLHAADPARQDKAGKLWFKHCLRFQLIREEQGDANHVVAPEGFLQNALSLFGYGAEPTLGLETYLKLAPLPAALAVLRLDPTEAARRLTARPRQTPYPLSSMPPDQQFSTLARWAELQERVAADAASRGVTVIDVPSHRESSEGARILLEQIPEDALCSQGRDKRP